MAGSVNKVILVGRVGKDPETRNIGRKSSFEIAEFSLATSKTWRDRDTGERKEKTEWHNIKVMNDALVKNVVRPYVKKGSLVYVEGEIETESWEDRNGSGKRHRTKIVIPLFGGQLHMMSSGDRQGAGRDDDHRDDYPGSGSGNYSPDLEDEIPF